MGFEISLLGPIGQAIDGDVGASNGYCPKGPSYDDYKQECPALKKLLCFAWYGAFSTIGSVGTVIPLCNMIQLFGPQAEAEPVHEFEQWEEAAATTGESDDQFLEKSGGNGVEKDMISSEVWGFEKV